MLSMYQMPDCPKIMHFIWAGGIYTLKPIGITIISEWAKANPDFKIYLWIDEKTAGKSLNELTLIYREPFKNEEIDVLANEESERKQINHAPIILKDIGRENLRDQIVAYEIDQLSPNYGASSDLLRYNILVRFGGAYFDCTDVHPNPACPLKILDIFKQNSIHTLYVDHLAQTINPSSIQLENFTTNTIGNDTFVSTKNNPLLISIAAAAAKNYELNDLGTIVMYGHASHHPKMITVSRTGPGLVRAVIGNQNGKDYQQEGSSIIKNIGKENVRILSVRNPHMQLTKPAVNTRFWLKSEEPQEPIMPDIALQTVMNSINYEAIHFKYLRLEHHAKILATTLHIPLLDALQRICGQLNNKDREFFSQIKYVPLMGLCPDTYLFCQTHKLFTLFELNQSARKIALEIETNAIEIAAGLSGLKEILSSHNPQERLAKIPDEIKLDWHKQMAHGLQFIEFLAGQQPLMQGKPDAKTLYPQAITILKNYRQFNELLIKSFPDIMIFRENEKRIESVISVATNAAVQSMKISDTTQQQIKM